MLKLFTFRYDSLRECRNNSDGSDASSVVSVADAPRAPKKKLIKSSKSCLRTSKSTKHLDLALKRSSTTSLDLGSDISQRYTKFPSSSSATCRTLKVDAGHHLHHIQHELRGSSSPSNSCSVSEPTHQRLVISAAHHQHHHHHSNRPKLTVQQQQQRTMPKNKTPSSRVAEGGSVPKTRNGSSDLDRNGSFMNKPVRGWLHPDRQISETGICYGVRYVGCLEVTTSMKSLDFDTRSQIAKECINKVCESGGLKTVDKRRKVDKKILKMLGDKPNMDFAGSNVNLTITSRSLNLTIMETGELIAEHEMPNVSFASGGDPDTLDFVAYVAKDHMYGRACFVLECGGGLAQDVITTVGQAFELRFKQYLNRGPSSNSDVMTRPSHGPSIGGVESLPPLTDDPEYYNDLPGKVPPDVPPGNPQSAKDIQSRELPAVNAAASNTKSDDIVEAINVSGKFFEASSTGATEKHLRGASADNLIDLNEEIGTPSKKPEPEYVNCDVIIKNKVQNYDEADGNNKRSETSENDPFDLQPFEGTLPSSNLLKPLSPVRNNLSQPSSSVLSPENTSDQQANSRGMQDQKQALLREIWYHGPISRKESESLVVNNGNFLVRESQGSPGQYVLTGMQGGIKKHLLLVDPEGVVRTKDRTFESVSHLINYHSKNGLPIIAADSELVLSKPIRMKN